jgi:hypothetical protein
MNDSSLLPENKWIYMYRNQVDPKDGMWFYICGNGQNMDITSKSDIQHKKLDVTHLVTTRINPCQDDLSTSTKPTILHDIDNARNHESLSTPAPPDTTDQPMIVNLNSGSSITCLNNTEFNDPTSQVTDPTTTTSDLILSMPDPIPLVSNTMTMTIQEIPEPVPQEVKTLMTDMLDTIIQEELKASLTPSRGLNEPNTYNPTIIIDPPALDPTVKKRRIAHKGYDPTNPKMGNKPFICPICDKTFKNKGALVRHEQSNHSDSHYECYECNRKFFRKDSIRRHYNINHKGVPLPTNLVLTSTKMGTPPKLVQFNLKSKPSEKPVSQFAKQQIKTTTEVDKVTLIQQLMDTLQSLQ